MCDGTVSVDNEHEYVPEIQTNIFIQQCMSTVYNVIAQI